MGLRDSVLVLGDVASSATVFISSWNLLIWASIDLALGFFSSSGFRALSLGFAYFIANGGSMRIIINNILQPTDKDAIIKGITTDPNDLINPDISENLEQLYSRLSQYDEHFFNCISWLIAKKKLEIVSIVPKTNSSGIAHQKFGRFSDKENNKVAFNGSVNFSTQALFHNMEAISCYRSWSGDSSDVKRIQYFERAFENIWNGHNKNVGYVPIENVKTSIRTRFKNISIEELLNEEQILFEEFVQNGVVNSQSINRYRNKVQELKSKLAIKNRRQRGPEIPQTLQLRDYQLQALEAWKSSNYIGIFEMATGTGKTFTALNCAIDLFKTDGSIKVLVLVPTIPLANQWKEEARQLNFENIVMINSSNSDWQQSVLQLINQDLVNPVNMLLISTYQAFGTPQLNSIMSKLADNTLLIADEVHNFGTKRHTQNYPVKILKRIGLSATPARYMDEEGSNAILDFFNSAKSPTFSLNMKEAIERGLLCRYYYYPRIAYLEPEELSLYKEISKTLAKYFNSNNEKFLDNPVVGSLLIKRKRIINQANNKLDCLRNILFDLTKGKEKLNYTFVYVPEGTTLLAGEKRTRLIDEYAKVISNEFGLKQHQFIGGTKERNSILKKFSTGEIEVLTAMKCLDEGIDVKRAEVAIFSASTGNPRQFIQRRGRILRTHPDKNSAYIYDMIVVPSEKISSFSDSNTMEQNLLKKELLRVAEFANLAMNKFEALQSLEHIAREYNIDIFNTQYL